MTVRTLLSWFWGSQRRGQFIVFSIRAALEALALRTEPDFNLTYLDGMVEFLSVSASEPEPGVAQTSGPNVSPNSQEKSWRPLVMRPTLAALSKMYPI